MYFCTKGRNGYKTVTKWLQIVAGL